MDLPRSVQIGPVVYTIEHNQRVTNATNCWGRIDYHAQTISLDPNQQPDHLAVTLLHEVLHGIWFYGHLAGFEGDVEKTLAALAPALLDTFRRNPDLVVYLMEGGTAGSTR